MSETAAPTIILSPMILAKATWTEVDALDLEEIVAVVPIGGTEMNGRSAPMGAATILADAVAEGLERRFAEGVLIVPTLPFSIGGATRSVTGCIDLGFEAFSSTVRAVVHSLRRQGIRRFLLLLGGASPETYHALHVVGRMLKSADPSLQTAILDDGIEWRSARLAALGAIDPAHVRIASEYPPNLDLIAPSDENVDVSSPAESQKDTWTREGLFVTDVGEGDTFEWAITTEPVDVEWGAKVLDDLIAEAATLVETMRQGRIYLEVE